MTALAIVSAMLLWACLFGCLAALLDEPTHKRSTPTGGKTGGRHDAAKEAATHE